jgi:hypothetical protein
MKNLFYVAAGLLVIMWVIVLYNFKTSNAVHILLVVAFFSVLIGFFNRKRIA